jgi:hypothetical protein
VITGCDRCLESCADGKWIRPGMVTDNLEDIMHLCNFNAFMFEAVVLLCVV